MQEGPGPLPWLSICGIHMHAEKMIWHQRIERCNQVADMWMQRRDVEISQRER